jgi:transcriptional regulator with XRE-family HTH domain
MTESIKIGERIAKAREAHKLSVTELAERAGLSADLVKGIEHDELPASLTPLIKIARALGVRLGTFLDDSENIGPVVSRAGAPASAVRFAGKSGFTFQRSRFFSLALDKSGRHMEPFFIDIHASSAQNAKPRHTKAKNSFMFCKGSVE